MEVIIYFSYQHQKAFECYFTKKILRKYIYSFSFQTNTGTVNIHKRKKKIWYVHVKIKKMNFYTFYWTMLMYRDLIDLRQKNNKKTTVVLKGNEREVEDLVYSKKKWKNMVWKINIG